MVKHSFATPGAWVSNLGMGMWQDSGCFSKVNGFPQVLQVPSPCKTPKLASALQDYVYKFNELSV